MFLRNYRSGNRKQVINSKIIYFILIHWNQNFANKIYSTYKDMYIHMCKNLGFKISERKRKMIRPTTKNRCVLCSSTDLSLNPLTLTFFLFFVAILEEKKLIAQISFCHCHRLSLSSCGFATSFYKVFSLYTIGWCVQEEANS